MTIVAIIPARSGSKGVPKKNIYNLGGYPLIAYSIIASKLTKKINRTIVSTDSSDFTFISTFYGAEAPFLRPSNISQDNSTNLEFIEHFINYLNSEKSELPEYIVQLNPTTPLRIPETIDHAITTIIQNPDATSLRSAHEIRESHCKLFAIKDDNKHKYFEGLCSEDPRPEYYNLPRQSFKTIYQPNGYVDIIKTKTLVDSDFKSLHGDKIFPFITNNTGEIDSIDDLDYIEYLLKKRTYKIHEYLKLNYGQKQSRDVEM